MRIGQQIWEVNVELHLGPEVKHDYYWAEFHETCWKLL